MTRILCLLLGLAAALAGSVAARAQPAPALRLEIVDSPVPAIDPATPACDANDIPDTPARAIRLANRVVQLYSTDPANHVDAGPDLLHLRHDCTVLLRGANNDDPAAYDDRAWIASPWTADGRTIWAVVHNEFHGHLRKALCPTGKYMDCWFNALTLAVSRDSGRSFQRAAGPAPAAALVAALPYRYDEVGLGHHGYFNPSNIVGYEGGLYMTAFATSANAQRPGNCLLRTETITRANAWRAWDGTGFTVQFSDPYAGPVQPEQHVCTPVGVGSLRWPVTSLVRHQPSGLFIALMQNGARDGGVFYATSPDLIRWSAPAILMPAIGLGAWTCGDPEPIAYPSLLDPSSPSRNFETVGATAALFATRFNVERCRTGMNRTLIRSGVRIVADDNLKTK